MSPSKPVAKRATSIRTLDALDDDVVAHIVRAAQAVGLLAPLASSSRQLCTSARSRTEYSLHVRDQEQALLLLNSQRSGRPAFSGCKQLQLEAADAASIFLASGVLGVAQQWPALQQLQLSMKRYMQQLPPGPCLDFSTPQALFGLRGLQHLQSLDLCIPHFNTSSAGHVGSLKQLTALTVAVMDTAADAPADLLALSGLSSLRVLTLPWPPAVQPAAAEGPYCLPPGLSALVVDQIAPEHRTGAASAAPMASWLTHVPGCCHLTDLALSYGDTQHASAHPIAVVRLLAQHTPHLRGLSFMCAGDPTWDTPVARLPDAAPPAGECAWATLRQLEFLCVDNIEGLGVDTQEQWQQLTHLSGLTMLQLCPFNVAPQQGTGTMLALLELDDCFIELSGHELGLLLLACPVLREGDLRLYPPTGPEPEPPAGAPLPQHPTLQQLRLHYEDDWGSTAAHFAGVAGVLGGLESLVLNGWQSNGLDTAAFGLPDLAACTALTALTFEVLHNSIAAAAPQQDVLLMLAPVVQLRHVSIRHVLLINAFIVGWLQGFMPHLQSVSLYGCGRLVPAVEGVPGEWLQSCEALAYAKVQRLLRPGVMLYVGGW